jgi:hypothetical protein
MTTKNLSRTAIEGGRTGGYKAECNKRIRQERAAWRTQTRRIARDLEAWEDDVPAIRQPVYPEFADKLRPIYRFLDAHVGDSWDAVRSELFARFDTRTTPGRHVLFDHVLRDVAESPEPDAAFAASFRSRRYFRDEDGILRKDQAWVSRRSWRSDPPFKLEPVARWLGCRKVGRAGGGFAQYVASGSIYGARVLRFGIRAIVERGQIVYAFVHEDGSVLRREVPPVVTSYGRVITQPPALVVTTNVSFRQDGLLSDKDAAYMRALPSHVQEMICAHAPANV